MAKITIMSSWNACCGVSTHAELIGEAFLRQGHELTVYAPRQYEDNNTLLYFVPDQDYVVRNYSFLRYGDRYIDENLLNSMYLDSETILEGDFDLLIVEKPTSTPLGKLNEVLKKLRKENILAILHEGSIPANPYFSKIDWGSLIVFDERYKSLFSSVFPEDELYIVPFPCHPVDRRDKREAREWLRLPSDAPILFSFGRMRDLNFVLESLKGLEEDYPEIVYLYLVGYRISYESVKSIENEYSFLEIRFGRPPTSELYNYLGVADAILFNKPMPKHVAVSSSAHLCLGSLTPIICSDVAYFETLGNEVIKYRGADGLKNGVRNVIEKKGCDVLDKAERFVELHSADVIAKRLLEIGLGEEQ